MPPHVERMRKERDELCDKLSALNNFITTNALFGQLDPARQCLMTAQYHTMRTYISILETRIGLEAE